MFFRLHIPFHSTTTTGSECSSCLAASLRKYQMIFTWWSFRRESKCLNNPRFCWKKIEPQSEVWPSPRFEHASLMLKNHLLIFAGKSDLNKICEDMLVFNIRDSIWQKICLLKRPSGRQDCKMVQIEDKIYLFGGRNAINNEFFADLWEFQIGQLNINAKTNITSVTSRSLETSGKVPPLMPGPFSEVWRIVHELRENADRLRRTHGRRGEHEGRYLHALS